MYAEKKFTESSNATLGLDFVKKTFKPKNFPDKEMQVKIWDTRRPERFGLVY
jgi:GTPase SAR1 family protein